MLGARGGDARAQELGREVNAAGPDDRVQHRVELAGGEVGEVLERREDGRVEIIAQIGDTLGAVIEAEPELVRGKDARVGDVENGGDDDGHGAIPRERWGPRADRG
jgi:hypothetical protein